MNSRDLSFADQIRATVGAVDVVFNSLAGEAFFQSIELLEPYGRFIEIGKGEILKDSGLPMAVFNRNISFTAIDLDRIAEERPEEIGRLLRNVAAGFEDGHFQPIPVEAFEAAQAKEAFRLMASSKHIGKIVVRMEGQEVPVRVSREVSGGLREDGTYLVTGGNAGFGLEVGKWLARRGAGHVVLASRSGARTPEAKTAIAKLRASGMRVTAVSLDVTDESQVARFMESLTEHGEVLRGIVHGAMVLDDDWLANLDAERFAKVLAPKVAGALNLHKYAGSSTLDFFVSFSSITSLFGNAGQGAYAAANAFLDSFSTFQRAEGVPGMTINWGVLSDAGVAARNPEVALGLGAAGIRGLPVVRALAALEALLQDRPVQAAVVDVDWLRLRTARPGLVFSPIVRDLVATESSDARRGMQIAESEIQRELADLEPGKRQERMLRFLAEELAHILRLPAEKIDPQQDVNDLGLDSLMAMELVTVVELELALRLSPMELMGGTSLESFSKRLIAMAFPEERG
jgi:NADP-dependent 3-hydroxy acid dehydrogenase YdfG/acyl carrier protein